MPLSREKPAKTSTSASKKRQRDDNATVSATDQEQLPSAKRSKNSKGAHKADEFRAKFDETLTDQEILEIQMKNWDASCYAHFKLPPDIVEEGGIVKYRFYCLACPTRFVTRARHDDATSNLGRHAFKECPSINEHEKNGQLTVAEFARGSTYNPHRLRLLHVKLCSVHHRPFAMVEDDAYQEILTMFHAAVDIKSAVTLSRDLKDVFNITHAVVKSKLRDIPGRKHISLDGWSSPNIMSVLGILVSYVEKGEIKTLTLDTVRLLKSHTGEYLAERLSDCLERFGIADQTLGIAMDNASNNDTMIAELPTLLPSSSMTAPTTQIRCFGHVGNLVEKGLLLIFNTDINEEKKGKNRVKSESKGGSDDEETGSDTDSDGDDTESDDEEELDDDDEIEYDEAQEAKTREEADLAELLELDESIEEVRALSDDEEQAGRATLTKLRKLGKKFRNNDLLQEELVQLCKSENISPKKLIRPVDTRWNTMLDVIERALYLRPVLDRMLSMAKFTKKGKGRIRLVHLKLTPEEWELLTELRPILKWFKIVIERFSKTNRPLLAEVIPYIDSLTKKLERVIKDSAKPPIIRAAAARSRAVLNKYYGKTDDSIMYRMCMLLHPRFKLSYFRQEGWPKEWEMAAIQIIREHWKEYYEPLIETSSTGNTADDLDDDNSFADVENFGRSRIDDVLEAYLNEPTIDDDPIKFWTSRLDPPGATSTDVERLFSHGGLQVTKRRHNLSYSSLRCLMVLRSWFLMGLVPDDEVIKCFREKSSRRGAGRNEDNAIEIVE
ncbi:hypothetical protein K435DRAFT_798347 [Dendrothele bispora CBS 962.96]|uniref:HAT C-terminal dimerisation domain-containing protein n=1 Tax=Dendrothele bispora (strain CBS 962.96) TaxID=1314807 RepID=A0A4S8LZT6_DENBC|nr:hypothetical protein K435DRAFT_798347 [Dendrothele bispora CBS 962.96]